VGIFPFKDALTGRLAWVGRRRGVSIREEEGGACFPRLLFSQSSFRLACLYRVSLRFDVSLHDQTRHRLLLLLRLGLLPQLPSPSLRSTHTRNIHRARPLSPPSSLLPPTQLCSNLHVISCTDYLSLLFSRLSASSPVPRPACKPSFFLSFPRNRPPTHPRNARPQ
jgi:hypothetical protein